MLIMDLSRLGSGVYRFRQNSEDFSFVSGKLHHALNQAKRFSPEATLDYLKEVDGIIDWHPVNVEQHEHYHGAQTKELLKFFYDTNCALSITGYKKFEIITGVSAGRIQDAIRRADSESFKPLSAHAHLFVKYKVSLYLSKP